MVMKLVLFAIIIMAVVVLALGVGIFFGKKKKFPETSIEKNKELQKLNIKCAKHEELHNCGIDGGCCGGANHKD